MFESYIKDLFIIPLAILFIILFTVGIVYDIPLLSVITLICAIVVGFISLIESDIEKNPFWFWSRQSTIKQQQEQDNA